MKNLRSIIKKLRSKKPKKDSFLEELQSKSEEMQAELASLSQFENFLKELKEKK